eukprot:TRINITY_DN15278_c0_g1_i1.p1 TRINITY_DN15278_c0_g1~~TRINITY_DN15278_c0_g1_i1.p1  ORF type:complete len:426 (+),score=72.85 TRINITY_DN15278_c0_g1_i1:224-1501(+)
MHTDRARDLGLFRWDQRGMANEGNGSDAILAQWNQHGVSSAAWHSLAAHPSRELSEEDCGGESCDRNVGDKLEHRFDKHDGVDFRGGRMLTTASHGIVLKATHPVYGEDIGRKMHRVGGGGRPAGCQVEGCGADLGACKGYHQKHKVCEQHAKAASVLVGGHEQRFCQQCSRFHPLSEFDEGKRSCRGRLSGHNKRRRKSVVDTGIENPGALVPHVGIRQHLPAEVDRTGAERLMNSAVMEVQRDEGPAASKEDLLLRMRQMEAVLAEKSDMINKMTGLLKSYVTAEGFRSRSKHQASTIEDFAVGMFEVVDELVQVKSSVPDQYRWDVPGADVDTGMAMKLIKTLLEGVAKAEQNILRVFRQHGVERFDATGEQYDGERHKSINDFPDSSEDPGTVALTVKKGFTCNGNVLRPAEVHVVRGGAM